MGQYSNRGIKTRSGRRYVLTELLASGGQGHVYLTDESSIVAKILEHELKADWEKRCIPFVVQNELWKTDKSLNSLPQDTFVLDSCAGYVAQRAPGATFSELLENDLYPGELSLFNKLHIARDLTRGVALLHRHQIIIADLCEANVVIHTRRSALRIIDIDGLGILSSYQPLIAKPASAASPELHHGMQLPDQLSDLWSLAIVIHKILLDSHPFPYPNLEALHHLWTKTPALQYPLRASHVLKLAFLGDRIYNLFQSVFGYSRLRFLSGDRSNRPSAEIWTEAIEATLKLIRQCITCSQWFVPSLLSPTASRCPNCAR